MRRRSRVYTGRYPWWSLTNGAPITNPTEVTRTLVRGGYPSPSWTCDLACHDQHILRLDLDAAASVVEPLPDRASISQTLLVR